MQNCAYQLSFNVCIAQQLVCIFSTFELGNSPRYKLEVWFQFQFLLTEISLILTADSYSGGSEWLGLEMLFLSSSASDIQGTIVLRA